MKPRVEAAVGGQERRQPARQVRVDQLLDAALADVGQLGHADGGGVERDGHRLAVEVAARDDLAAVRRARRRRTPAGCRWRSWPRARAPRGRRRARRGWRRGPAACSAASTGSWTLPQSRCDSAIALSASRWRSSAPERDLARVRRGPQDARVERADRALERLERHGAGDVGRPQVAAASWRASPPTAVMCWVPLSRVRPSLASSASGARPARRSASAAGTTWPPVSASPSPIRPSARWASGARSPDAPTEPRAGTTGWTPAAEHLAQQVGDLGAGAGVAARQHRGAQQHHGADRVARQRRADAGRVRADQVALQLADLGRRDADLGEGAEAGVDAVDRRRVVAAVEHRLDHGARGGHAGAGGGSQQGRAAGAGYLGQAGEVDGGIAQDHGLRGRGGRGHRAAIPAAIPHGQASAPSRGTGCRFAAGLSVAGPGERRGRAARESAGKWQPRALTERGPTIDNTSTFRVLRCHQTPATRTPARAWRGGRPAKRQVAIQAARAPGSPETVRWIRTRRVWAGRAATAARWQRAPGIRTPARAATTR